MLELVVWSHRLPKLWIPEQWLEQTLPEQTDITAVSCHQPELAASVGGMVPVDAPTATYESSAMTATEQSFMCGMTVFLVKPRTTTSWMLLPSCWER